MENRNEEIFNALLKIAAEESIKQDVENMPSCEELNKIYKPSPAFDRKIRKLISKHMRKKAFIKVLRKFSKFAAVVCICITISSAVLLSVEASRNLILNTLMDKRDDHLVFEFDSVDYFNEGKGFYSMGYIPDGYEIIDSQSMANETMSLYANNAGSQIIFQQYLGESLGLGVNTDDTDYEVILVNQQEAHLFSRENADDFNVLMWKPQNIALTLISDVGKDELIQIAEKIFRK